MFPNFGNKFKPPLGFGVGGLVKGHGLRGWLQKSPLAQELLSLSHLDKRTLEALVLYSRSETTFERVAQALGIQRSGAWKRWRRGRDAIMRSFYTLELAIYAGVLEPEVAELLAQDLQDLAALARAEGDLEELSRRIEKRIRELLRLRMKRTRK